MRMNPLKRERCFHPGESGVVSIEFAAVTPVLVLMIIAAFDLARAFQVDQQALSAASAIVHGASTLSLQPDQSLSLNTTTATTAMTAFYGAFPQAVPENGGSYPGNYAVILSAIQYSTATPPQPSVIWSSPLSEGTSYNQSSGFLRSCGAVSSNPSWPGGQANQNVIVTLNVPNPTSVLVADVSYQYDPVFYGFLTGPITFWESAAYPMPSGGNAQTVCYVPNAASDKTTICSGYVATQCTNTGS